MATELPEDGATPRALRTPSARPALVVVGIAAGLLLLFGIGAAISGTQSSSSGSGARPATSGNVPGTTLTAVPATQALTPLTRSGEPPSNVTQALTLPKGSSVLGTTNRTPGAGLYDEQLNLTAFTSQNELIAFYRRELPRLGWQVFSTGPAQRQPGFAVLAKKAGDDGWYWEVGAVIAPTTARGLTNTTGFSIRLIQISDSA